MKNFAIMTSQWERETIQLRLREKWAMTRERGKWIGGIVPFGYRVEAETAPGEWVGVLDRSDAREDLLCDYRALPAPVRALRVRLVVTSHPPGIEPGVIDFTAFGPVEAPVRAGGV